MLDFSFFLNCFSDRSFNVITDSIPDLSTLISNINSIVCSCFGQSISHSRGEPCVVIMGFFNRSEKTLKLAGRSRFLNLYIKTAM